MIDVQVISSLLASSINEELSSIGTPPENRVVICVNSEKQTQSGLIIPDEVSEGVAKKGVIVQRGEITEEYAHYSGIANVGIIAYYGDYAGKELDLEVKWLPKGAKLRVLSINEIMYFKNNTQ